MDGCGQRYDFDSADVWSFFHSFCFDVSVWEIFGALLHGATCLVVPYQVLCACTCRVGLLWTMVGGVVCCVVVVTTCPTKLCVSSAPASR